MKFNNKLETPTYNSSKNLESFKELNIKENDVNPIKNIVKTKLLDNNTDINNKNLNINIDDEKNDILKKNNIIKSISKKELPAIKNIIVRNENSNTNLSNNVRNSHPYIINNDLLIRKKINNIFNILNKKNLIQKNQINHLGKYNQNKYLNNNIYNINRINNIRRKINYALDIQKESANSKVPNKIRLNPIKHNNY